MSEQVTALSTYIEDAAKNALGAVNFPEQDYVSPEQLITQPDSALELILPRSTVHPDLEPYIPPFPVAAPLILDKDLADAMGPYATLNTRGLAVSTTLGAYPHINPEGDVVMLLQHMRDGSYPYDDFTQAHIKEILSNIGAEDPKKAFRTGYLPALFEAFNYGSSLVKLWEMIAYLQANQDIDGLDVEVTQPTLFVDSLQQIVRVEPGRISLHTQKEPVITFETWSQRLITRRHYQRRTVSLGELQGAIDYARDHGLEFKIITPEHTSAGQVIDIVPT